MNNKAKNFTIRVRQALRHHVKTIGAIVVVALAVVFQPTQHALSSLCWPHGGAHDAETANDDLAKSGSITTYGDSRKIWVSTNVVSVDGTNYGCKLMVQVHKFYNEGTLAQTTNDVLI